MTPMPKRPADSFRCFSHSISKSKAGTSRLKRESRGPYDSDKQVVKSGGDGRVDTPPQIDQFLSRKYLVQ